MDGNLCKGLVIVGGDAKQRFHDTRGYGNPGKGNTIELDPIEAAYLLLRGDIDSIDEMNFIQFTSTQEEHFFSHFSTYQDLRSRGFFVTPLQKINKHEPHQNIDLIVYERGTKPKDGRIKYKIRVVGEHSKISAMKLGGYLLAIVDDEGELTYFNTQKITPIGTNNSTFPHSSGILSNDSVLLIDPDKSLHKIYFFGQELFGTNHIKISLVEAAYLYNQGSLSIDEDIVKQGYKTEGDSFKHRLTIYTNLRDQGLLPKTGFKFGSDFRVYQNFNKQGEPIHSEYLVKVLEKEHIFSTQEISLNVRLAVGVRKRTLFGIAEGNNNIRWILVERVTP
jgi:tRNA-intron endonuclease